MSNEQTDSSLEAAPQPIVIVDYGVGNIGALINMLEHLGIEAVASADASRILAAPKLILPGVGAFDAAMRSLRQHDLIGPLNEAVLERQRPILGVCLGMQLFARGSEEGHTEGLAWIPADVRRITVEPTSGLKVPHIGWTDVHPARVSHLFPDPAVRERYYFVHSYHMSCDDPNHVLATIQYESPVCCAVGNGLIQGVQFHPEKSHRFGMRLLQSFAEQ